MKICTRCRWENNDNMPRCDKCGTNLTLVQSIPETHTVTKQISDDILQLNHQQLLGIVGSALLVFGVFCPIIQMPVIGSINYFQNGLGDGVVVLILAVASFFFALYKRLAYLAISAILVLAVLGFTFINFQLTMKQAYDAVQKNIDQNPFGKLGESMVGMVQLSWGWGVLILGLCCLFGAVFIGDYREDQ